MLKLSCPACGGEVIFRSKASVYVVCSFCKSTLVRQDMNLEAFGKMADLQDDMTPLQLLTSGSFEGKPFELVGRLRVRWEEGFWNEWYAIFSDGHEGWLAEAQGFYMVSFQAPLPENLPPVDGLKPGIVLALANGEKYQVDDIKSAQCVGSEGELPLQVAAGRKSVSVDLSGPERCFASIEYAEAETRFFVGKYVEFDDLNFRHLREIDGW